MVEVASSRASSQTRSARLHCMRRRSSLMEAPGEHQERGMKALSVAKPECRAKTGARRTYRQRLSDEHTRSDPITRPAFGKGRHWRDQQRREKQEQGSDQPNPPPPSPARPSIRGGDHLSTAKDSPGGARHYEQLPAAPKASAGWNGPRISLHPLSIGKVKPRAPTARGTRKS